VIGLAGSVTDATFGSTRDRTTGTAAILAADVAAGVRCGWGAGNAAANRGDAIVSVCLVLGERSGEDGFAAATDAAPGIVGEGFTFICLAGVALSDGMESTTERADVAGRG
jgi:hypothetical protein